MPPRPRTTAPRADRPAPRRWIVGAALLAAVVAAAPAAAGIVSHQAAFAATVSSAGVFEGRTDRRLRSITLGELPRFDAALGTLTGVSLSFGSSLDAWLYGRARDTQAEGDFIPLPPFIINGRNDAGLGAAWAIDLNLALFDPGGAGVGYQRGLGLTGECGERVSAEAAVECSFIRRLEIGLGGGLDLSSVPLAAFVGVDPVNFFVEIDATLTGLCDADDSGDVCGFDPLTSVLWSGTATIDYRYDGAGSPGPGDGGGDNPPGPAPVPAPASLWLAGLGLLLARSSARRARPQP